MSFFKSKLNILFSTNLLLTIIISVYFINTFCKKENFKNSNIKRKHIKKIVEDIKNNNKKLIISNLKKHTNNIDYKNDCLPLLNDQSTLFRNQMNNIKNDNNNLINANNDQYEAKKIQLKNNYTNIIKDKQANITELTYQISNLENALSQDMKITENLQNEMNNIDSKNNELKEELIYNRTYNTN